MYRYSVLTWNVGGYEVLHEIEEKTEGVEYVYVTDDRSISSSTWDVVYIDNPHPEDNFDLCFYIRYNPFEFVHSDTVIKIDGSMGVSGNLDKLIDVFNEGQYDRLVEIHPTRATIYEERLAWVQQRNFPVEQANKVLDFLVRMEGYDVMKIKGLIQANMGIERKNRINALANEMTLAFCHYLAEDGKQIERVDQDIFSFVINKYFPTMKILPVSQKVATSGRYFKWYAHNSNIELNDSGIQFSQPYLRGEPINTYYVFE